MGTAWYIEVLRKRIVLYFFCITILHRDLHFSASGSETGFCPTLFFFFFFLFSFLISIDCPRSLIHVAAANLDVKHPSQTHGSMKR